MKKCMMIFCILGVILTARGVNAQPVAALHQAGETQYFYGSESFREAVAVAAAGSTIYLSGGNFVAPDSIFRPITVFGTGHHPEYTGATGQTVIAGNVNVVQGADNAYFEGIHFLNMLNFGSNRQIDNLVFRRCRIDGVIQSSLTAGNQNHIRNALFTECVMQAGSNLNFHNFRDLTITNSIISGLLYHVHFGLVANSVLLSVSTLAVYHFKNSTMQNCIVVSTFPNSGSTTDSRFLNNVYFNNVGSFNWGASNVQSSNHSGVDRSSFFADQSGNIFLYTHDYHLQTPGQFIGTDGSQVGIYGGMHPFKEGSVPMIPHVISKKISHVVDADGKLQVEIEVSAQDH